MDASILLLNLRTELVGLNQTKTVYEGAMKARTLELQALYSVLERQDGISRRREDDLVLAAAELDAERAAKRASEASEEE